MHPRTLTTKWSYRRLDSPPGWMPKDAKGNPIPLEWVCLADFYSSRQAQSEDGHEVVEDTRFRLSDLRPVAPSPRMFHESYTIRTDGPAIHYLAVARFGPPLDAFEAEFRLVARPTQGYIFLASYFVAKPGPADHWPHADCYHVRNPALTADADCDSAAEAAIRQEIDDLVHCRRGPKMPHWGVTHPIMTVHRTSIGKGAVEFRWNPTDGNIAIEIQRTLVLGLTRPDIETGRKLVDGLRSALPLPMGARTDFTADQIREAVRQATIASEILLSNLPAHKSWPCFRNPSTARVFVAEHIAGAKRQLEIFAQELNGGTRRPSPRILAVRVVARWSGLSQRRVRDLIRK